MKRALFLAAALLCTSAAPAQNWMTAQSTVGQVALDFDRNPALANQKYQNVEIIFADEFVTGKPQKFPSGRTYLPLVGLGTDDHFVKAIFPSGEIPAGIGHGAEISMVCTAQGFYTSDGHATMSASEGSLVLACGNLKVLSMPTPAFSRNTFSLPR